MIDSFNQPHSWSEFDKIMNLVQYLCEFGKIINKVEYGFQSQNSRPSSLIWHVLDQQMHSSFFQPTSFLEGIRQNNEFGSPFK